MSIYHTETQRIYDHLQRIKHTLVGSTSFTLADLAITINGKDGLGGLIEEWFGVWAENEGYQIINPKKEESSQTFPDYYVGNNCDGYQYLEIKTFDADASANFDIANFQSYCALMNPLMILVKIIKLRWIHILSYDQMVSRKINNQTTRCANSIFYTTLFTNSAPNYT
ncbi:NgoBV family restriction endonuclease [[Pasteurella] aerogenes]